MTPTDEKLHQWDSDLVSTYISTWRLVDLKSKSEAVVQVDRHVEALVEEITRGQISGYLTKEAKI